MKFRILSLLAIALFAAPLTANAAIINGGFETGDLTGWLCADADACDVGEFAPHSGTYHMWGYDNEGFATLSQTIATVVGTTYRLDFYSLADIVVAANILRYQIGGGAIQDVVTTSTFALTSTNFVASAPNTSISFFFETDGETGAWVIDDVSVAETDAVPAPGLAALIALGFAGVAGRRWRLARTRSSRSTV